MRARPVTALVRWLATLVVWAGSFPSGVHGQLISPGRLAAPHEALEGLRGCTSCHQLGQRGVSSERCLACHDGVAARVEEGTGYHATVPADACGSCHQDHLGPGFDLLHLEEGDFDHDLAGFALSRSHGEVACRDCHAPDNIADEDLASFKRQRGALERTFLGLGTACATCHATDDPHAGQFDGRSCAQCHDEGAWTDASAFDHATADFVLEGAHQGVDCAECHASRASVTLYRPVAAAACSDCHDDPHGGAMRVDCASCHDESGWRLVAAGAMDVGFDHGTTAFALNGAHAVASCADCHRTGAAPRTETVSITYRAGTSHLTYPRPISTTCASCHVAGHLSPERPERWATCAACHSEAGWAPSSFGIARHRTESDVPLTGAHVATPCIACHETGRMEGKGWSRFDLALGSPDCGSCHGGDDPHGGSYGDLACAACHTTVAFQDVAFDHAATVGPEVGCAACHADIDPHGDQFEGRDCRACHGTEAFSVDRFDHAATRFPLEGAHDRVPCRACHEPPEGPSAGPTRYRPLDRECRDCHGGAP
jgi:hypothetical protein